MEEEENKKTKPVRKYRWLRRLGRVFLGILIFLVLLVLFIRSPWGQNIIVGEVVDYVKGKTGTEVSLDRAFITFDGNIQIDGLYLADKQNDTLVFSRSLEASIPLLPIIQGNGYNLDYAKWDGLKARISRKDTVSGFNYQFLIDAFVPADTTATVDQPAEPLQLSIGDVDFTNFDVTLQDDVEKLDAVIKFDEFHLSMNELDLEQMIVDINEISLTNAIIKYNKDTVTAFAKAEPDNDPNTDTTIAEAITDDAGDSPLPNITVGNMKIDNAVLGYVSVVDGINLDSKIGLFETALSTADVQNSKYVIDFVTLNNSDAVIKMNTVKPIEPFVFEWPELNIEVEDINLTSNDVLYTLDGATSTRGSFNPNALDFKNVHLVADNLNYNDAAGSVEIMELSGSENSGLTVHQLSSNIAISDQQIKVADLNAQVNNNSLQGDATLGFDSFVAFMDDPTNMKINAAIPSYAIDLSDVFLFQPDLRSNEYLFALSKRRLTGSLRANGSTSSLNIPNLVANWGNETAVMATGSLRNAMDPDNLYIDFPNIKMRSTRADMIRFVNEQDLGIELPQRFSLAGSVQGSIDDIETKATLTTTDGIINLNGAFKNQNVMEFNAMVEATEVDLGKILKMPELGKLNLNINAKGSGSTLNDLDATIDANVNSFSYNGYEIKNLPINGSFQNGNGEVSSKYRDSNVDLTLQSQIKLDSIASQADLNLDIAGIDLRAFGITNQNVKGAGNISAYFKGDFENFEATAQIADGIAVFDEQSYLLGDVNAKAFVQTDTTSVDITNKMLDLKLRSNTDPANLVTALQRHIDRYLTQNVSTDSIRPVVMQVEGNISPSPMLRDVILPSLEALDTINIAVDFNEMERKLDADITVPYLKYAGSEIDSLLVTSRSDAQSLKFDIGFKDLEAGPLGIKRTNLSGVVAQNELNIDFISYDEEEVLMRFGSTLSRKRNPKGLEDLIFRLKLEDLILNREPWSVPNDNGISYGENRMAFTNFKLSNDSQSVELRSDIAGIDKDHVGLVLDNFRLQALLSFLNPDEKLATGRLNGQLVLEDLFNKFGFSADLSIDDLHVLETSLGRLKLEANSAIDDLYEMDMSLKGDDVDLSVTGNYRATPDAAQLNLNLDLQKLNMATVTGIGSDFVSDGSGNLSGNITLSGTSLDPIYEGTINFNNAGFTVNMLNAPFVMKNEQLKVNNDGLVFNNFEVSDADDNTFVVDGTVGTEDLLTPTFDLRLKADNFTALNSTASDNELYYGKATFDATATVTGNLTIPVVDLTLDVDDSTNVTYVIPATELDIVQRDGIVQFVNKENPDDILTQTEEESATLTGFDVTADLKISKGAVVNIIVDPTTGDNLKVAGDGDLKFRMTPNGRMTLAGRYEIDNGHYELSLYEIVSRKFDIAKGSSVSWSGDPFDAALDVSAIYQIETSASALMASQTSGADTATKNRFRQELPFLVYLNVDGELLQPVISFRLDMPDDEKGAIGGQVYGRVQQLNSQDQELNKQVFSLLVLNKFFPTSGADGSSGGTAAIARDNINQALSDQLNQFGGKLLGNSGVDLNFGLDSYTDYQGNSPQERTSLDVTASKKLLDDRLIVSVGSEVDIQGSAAESEGETPVIGNVSLEYLLNQSGQWRLKGFRRNQYDNVIDGQLVVSGISLIFTKEFNEFKNLFTKTVQEEALEAKRKEDEEARKLKQKAEEEKKRKEERQKQLEATKKEREEQEEKENGNQEKKEN